MADPKSAQQIQKELAQPFDPADVKWKAQVVKGARCLAVCYIDARLVMQRLDDVVGIGGWQDSYDLGPQSVLCRLRLKVEDAWIERQDTGGYSDQKEEGDKAKAGVSDALKRAAVKFGIGRYLHAMPAVWCDYDAQSKQVANPPKLKHAAGGALGVPEPPPLVPGDWLQARLKGKRPLAEALVKLAGVAKLGQVRLAWFPLIRELLEREYDPEHFQGTYLGGHTLAETNDADVAKAHQQWRTEFAEKT